MTAYSLSLTHIQPAISPLFYSYFHTAPQSYCLKMQNWFTSLCLNVPIMSLLFTIKYNFLNSYFIFFFGAKDVLHYIQDYFWVTKPLSMFFLPLTLGCHYQTDRKHEDSLHLHLQWIKLKIFSWTPKALHSWISNFLPTLSPATCSTTHIFALFFSIGQAFSFSFF